MTAGPSAAGRGAGAEVLVVCTGNVCRSPAAERLLRHRLPAESGIRVSSAGTRALVGRPMDPPMAALVGQAGAGSGEFTARAMSPVLVRDADLVLVMMRAQRSVVVAAEPRAVRRTFLLTELAVLADLVAAAGWPVDVGADPADRLRALPALAPAHRAALQRTELPGGGADPDVVDPFGRPAEVYERSMATISAAVDLLVAALA
ncbi:hypothetical protein [uncultured Modestobacter sp.]|uniref:arsenate reductase/protein-tyrosine-phosphatase family protein n=1 Tax=uncultured Modestobacter sp. TaxID=380048 RepID=UPI002634F5E3|nr:hypothetical protein [uncultured Modestobacter sp.]